MSLNENTNDVYLHYLQTEMWTRHQHFQNFNGDSSVWVDSVFNRVENHDENGSVVLFMWNLDLNVMEFKEEFVLRDERWSLMLENIMQI